MKKKILFCLLILIGVYTITGCGGKDSLHPNQTGYEEGKYFIDDLTFNLSDGFKESFQKDIYQLADDDNAIVIYFYHDKDVKITMNEYIENDPHDFLPNKDNINKTTINGNEWYKGVTNDNAYTYYTQLGNDIYSILIMPMFTTKTVLNNAISTLESSLYFK